MVQGSLGIFKNNPRFKEVDNLRSVLLMEAYFNFVKNLLIGVHMMRETDKSGMIPP